MKKHILIIAVALAAAGPDAIAQQQTANAASQSEAQLQITERLKEIVSIYEKMLEGSEALMAARGSDLNIDSVKIDLIEARIELAKEEGRFDTVADQLRQLESIYQRRLENTASMVEVGRAEKRDITLAQIPLLKTQIRLIRVTEDDRSEQGEGDNSE